MDDPTQSSPPQSQTIPLSASGNLPYHVHNGIDSPQVSFNSLTDTTGWVKFQTFAWANVTATLAITGLSGHDRWLLEYSIVGGANNIGLGIRLNGISTASYNYGVMSSADSFATASADTSIDAYLPTGTLQYHANALEIDGRVQNSLLGFDNRTKGTIGRQKAFGPGAVAAVTDLSQISFLAIGGTDPNNWTGKGVLYFRDLK
jgi:hypothetical protein